MSEQPAPVKKSRRNQKIFCVSVISIIIVAYVLAPKSTEIQFIDASENYVWVETTIPSDLGTYLIYNYYNITIPTHRVDYDHHFYAQAFYPKTQKFCDKKPFVNCDKIMMELIDEGNFRQQAGELNMTMKHRISENCFDDTKHAFCKSPKDLEKYLVSKGIMNDTG